jgi:uncharacterized protein
MKILAVSDLHGDTVTVKRLAKEAEKEKVDMILILGDVSVFGDLAKGMIAPFAATGKKVAFVSGNHDIPGTSEALAKKYDITDLERDAFVYRRIGVFGSGGTNVGPVYVEDKEIFDNLSNGFRYVSGAERKIMATHVHAAGGLVEKFSSFPGSKAVRKAIDKFKPDIHLCGHIHDMEGFEERIGNTIVFSVGKRGKIIEI